MNEVRNSIIAGILLTIIVIFLHHYYKHGQLYEKQDFVNAFWNLIKSHEGVIVIVLLVSMGILLVV